MSFVSVIIPVYNRSEMLLRAVCSVLEQSYEDLELIVVDDGSVTFASDTLRGFKDPRLTIFRQEHRGVASARNLAISHAKAPWIALLDSDDYWLPNKLKDQITYLSEHPQYRLAQCSEIWFRKEKRVNMGKEQAQTEGEIFARSLELCVISSSSVMLQSALYRELGGYDERMRVCEDYDYWLRVTARHCVGLVPGNLVVKHGGHADQLSHSEPALDRYRIYALVKLFIQNDLSDLQSSLVLRSIIEKSKVMIGGATKRGLLQRADLYTRVSALACESLAGGARCDTVDVFEQVFQEIGLDLMERVER